MISLKIYLYANIYLIFIWLFHRLLLMDLKRFQAIRVYLVSGLTGSLILPILIVTLSDYFSRVSYSHPMISQLQEINFIYAISSLAEFNPGYSFDWEKMLVMLIFLAAMVSGLGNLASFVSLRKIIRNSNYAGKVNHKIEVFVSAQHLIPFIYRNKIVIPESSPRDVRDLIIKHEALHFKLGHRFDNGILVILHFFYALNPFYYLLKSAIKLNHEYQVDHELLSSGIASLKYKMTLVKIGAGQKNYSIANGLNNYGIKKRIMMINNREIRAGRWRFSLLVPALLIVSGLIFISSVTPGIPNDKRAIESTIINNDTLHVEIVEIDLNTWDYSKSNSLWVMINRNADLLIDGNKKTLESVEDFLLMQYMDKLKSANGDFKNLSADEIEAVNLIVQRSTRTREPEYNVLLNSISKTLYLLNYKMAMEIYGKDPVDLSEEETAFLHRLVPLRIYKAPDKNI